MKFMAEILHSFCELSRLRINLEKNALFGINCESKNMVRLTCEISCGKESWPKILRGSFAWKYFQGFFFWEPVIFKMAKKLTSFLI